jgi:voltage-gated potassium channel
LNDTAPSLEPPTRRHERFEAIRDLFEGPMLALSLVMLALLVVEVALPLPDTTARAIETAQWFIWVAFALDYLIFLALAPDKRRYVRTNLFGLLTVVLPFLRVFRALRAVRAVRALRAVRAANLTRRGAVSLRNALQWSSFAYFSVLALVITFLSAVGIVYLESGVEGARIRSYGEALWWAVGVVTTIGSDLSPVTAEGRVFASVLYVLGLAIPAYLGGVIASHLIGQRSQDHEEAILEERIKALEAKLDRLLERGSSHAQESSSVDLERE